MVSPVGTVRGGPIFFGGEGTVGNYFGKQNSDVLAQGAEKIVVGPWAARFLSFSYCPTGHSNVKQIPLQQSSNKRQHLSLSSKRRHLEN